VPRWLRDNGLSIVLFGLFAIFLIGQSLTGWRTYNAQQEEHREPTVGFGTYLTTGHFVEATFENWESEFLQMASYVLLTIWLIQKGSTESKPPGGDPEKDADPRSVPDLERAPGPVRRGSWQLALYENSLGHRRGLHRGHNAVHVGHIHQHGHLGRVLRVDERPNVGDAQRAEDLFALWRGKPCPCPSRGDGRSRWARCPSSSWAQRKRRTRRARSYALCLIPGTLRGVSGMLLLRRHVAAK
jgi:Domain of unknown function (DUF6766)